MRAADRDVVVIPPLWLLDVDGVLNAVTRQPDRTVWPDWRHGTAHADGVDWPVCFSPTVTATISRLHRAGLAEVRWLTTWGAAANDELRQLLGLPVLDLAAPPPHRPMAAAAAAQAAQAAQAAASHGQTVGRTESTWWKLLAAQRIAAAEGDRALIWTDDDLRFEPAALAWAEQHLPRYLLVSPRRTVGLAPRQLDAIRRYCGEEAPWQQDGDAVSPSMNAASNQTPEGLFP